MGLFGSKLGGSSDGGSSPMASWIDATKLAQNTKWLQPVTPQEIARAAEDPVSTLGNIASGAATGAGAGKSFGPMGAAIGGIAGGAAGAINAAHDKQYDSSGLTDFNVNKIKDQLNTLKNTFGSYSMGGQ